MYLRHFFLDLYTFIHIHEHEHEYPFVMMIVMSGNVNNLSSKYLQSNEVSSVGNIVFSIIIIPCICSGQN